MMHRRVLFALVCLLHHVCVSGKTAKVFILAGQSNAVGKGSIDHLDLLMQNDTEYRRALWNGTGYKVSDHVYVRFQDHYGQLTVGRDTFYCGTDNQFGVELMLGWVLGDAFPDQTILIIKTAWGGKTLSIDFRPPSSGEGEYKDVKPIEYGTLYRQMVFDTLDTLDDLETYAPGCDDYEMAGFVWFQGWNGACFVGYMCT